MTYLVKQGLRLLAILTVDFIIRFTLVMIAGRSFQEVFGGNIGFMIGVTIMAAIQLLLIVLFKKREAQLETPGASS